MDVQVRHGVGDPRRIAVSHERGARVACGGGFGRLLPGLWVEGSCGGGRSWSATWLRFPELPTQRPANSPHCDLIDIAVGYGILGDSRRHARELYEETHELLKRDAHG